MRALKVSQALIRSFSSTARNRLENRVGEKQKLFQADNDLPVHLKGGGTDSVLYRLTMALCFGGPQRIGRHPATLRGAICFAQSTDSDANLIQKHP
ncbi:cytochrome c oxidase subunit 7A1, mitochondrial isoform X2 [Pteronotus mesoamericanus]|uniref:cytochrome c oxidase subunit 7A1, mitochondrial isoform X2 n=1 Tax=Pteronotus mesoamericanus TaxID=1884717 RepID=UPI0023EAF5A9|nr:cytochrome c oxidase subunit 7A1, mitochondrial isoform X2 [Pteronotus parnellii mesoamericanus]